MPENDDKSITRQDVRSTHTLPPVVAIGASAGGVQALQVLFDTVPDRTGACFVVILHLDPQSRCTVAPLSDRRQQDRRSGHHFFDVTERHNLQDALQDCQRQLKERTR